MEENGTKKKTKTQKNMIILQMKSKLEPAGCFKNMKFS
jgi:hypothetical protein